MIIYEKKVLAVLVNISTNDNIDKANNHLSPKLTAHKKDQNIWHWKSRSQLGQENKCGRVWPVNGIQIHTVLITGSPTVIHVC